MSQYKLLVVVAAICFTFILGYAKGHYNASLKCDAKIAKLQEQSQKQKDAEAAKLANASGNLESENEKAKIVYKTITKTVDKIIDRPVYRDVCFDDDGLQLVRAALAGTPADTR